jgi:hypothetical protein
MYLLLVSDVFIAARGKLRRQIETQVTAMMTGDARLMNRR